MDKNWGSGPHFLTLLPIPSGSESLPSLATSIIDVLLTLRLYYMPVFISRS